MPQEIKTITYSRVNCFLIKTGANYVLIDTGFPKCRPQIDKVLAEAGCRPGNLNLIIVTHSDFDHSGNCAYFRRKYGAKIAMHRIEFAAVEKGSMLLNRKQRSLFSGIFLGLAFKVVLLFMRFGKFERFRPDLYLDDGHDLLEFGLVAKVLHIPGHSRGSIGILTLDGDLFCGDLLVNDKKPGLNSLIDNTTAAQASVSRLTSLEINMVYPGHGQPFTMESFKKGILEQSDKASSRKSGLDRRP